MERLRRVARFWNWLPAFRAVAENEHLPTAAGALFVSAPGLSRAIRSLEKDLHVTLFRRTGRRIELNEDGRRFLNAVRDAMRVVHEATQQLNGAELDGEVRIASAGALTTVLLVPATMSLRKRHPGLVPVLITAPLSELRTRLLRGDLDVAFHTGPIDHEGLESRLLGRGTSSVYAGPGHPLHGRRRSALADVLRHPFVAPPPEASGRAVDGWPMDVTRVVALRVDQLRIGLEVCARGELLAVLPDVLVRSHPLAQTLRKLPGPAFEPTLLFASHRPSIGLRTRAEVIVAAVRREGTRLGVLAGQPSP